MPNCLRGEKLSAGCWFGGRCTPGVAAPPDHIGKLSSEFENGIVACQTSAVEQTIVRHITPQTECAEDAREYRAIFPSLDPCEDVK
jgi:hypothetical protein